MSEKGLLIVISGPSGAGKGSICDKFIKDNPNIALSISATTRLPRKGEKEGLNYYYKSRKEFENMIENSELLEWACFCGNYYGTPKEYVDRLLKQGKDVVLEIEVQGALKVKEQYPEGVYVFVLPPSIQELKKRIINRATESEESIKRRLKTAQLEFVHIERYNYIIVNEQLDKAVITLEAIVKAEKSKVERNHKTIKEVCK